MWDRQEMQPGYPGCRVKALCFQILAQFYDAILELLADKAKKDKREHQVAFLEERTRVPRLAKNITALEQNRIQIQRLFGCLCFFPHCRP